MRLSTSTAGKALDLEGDDLGDARDALLEDALDPLLQRDRRDGTGLAGPEEADSDGVSRNRLQADIATIHLDGGAYQLEGLFDPVFDRHRLVHPPILLRHVSAMPTPS